jgi:S-adenosylmethionine:tRNA ribosyltransferase-isomerase
MDVREFNFDLPADLIAQTPASDRSHARLLHLDRSSGSLAHHQICALPDLLRAGDLMVANDTRVFPARLLGRRVPSGGGVECLLIRRVDADPLTTTAQGEPESHQTWEALMHPGQKLKPGARVTFEGSTTIQGEVLARRFHGRRLIRLWTDDRSPLDAAVDAIGHMPLPPYIKRGDAEGDRERYQTVFARERGSIAAPTAGLHLTEALIDRLRRRGVETAFITLHVGYGTFQPVRVEAVEEHRLESERFEISEAAAAAVNRARTEGRRIIAVGTTTTRTLEAVALEHEGRIAAGSGSTDLFIHPAHGGFRFQVVQGLLTNFHLPQSSLLMLVSAFASRERVLAAYREAIRLRYRFYSYGDAMLIL